MPYEEFKKNGKYCIKNLRNGNVTCFSSAKKRENGIRVREAYSHGWKPKVKKMTSVQPYTKNIRGLKITVVGHKRKVKKNLFGLGKESYNPKMVFADQIEKPPEYRKDKTNLNKEELLNKIEWASKRMSKLDPDKDAEQIDELNKRIDEAQNDYLEAN